FSVCIAACFLSPFCLVVLPAPSPTLSPYTTLFRSDVDRAARPLICPCHCRGQRNKCNRCAPQKISVHACLPFSIWAMPFRHFHPDRKSTRLNSSHVSISYAVFCLTKKTYIVQVQVS